MRVLIVEDEVRLAETLRDLLELERYTADICHDGESGLDNALSDIYDLVILDVMLPKKDGFSVLRALLEDLAALEVAECVGFRPSDDAVTFCGFQDPVTLTVNYKTATGIEGIFEMNVGTQNMDGTGRYVRFGDEPAIYLMELELLDPMMRLAYQGMEEAS